MEETSKKKAPSHWPLTVLSSISSLFSLSLPLILVRVLSQSEVGNFKLFFLYLLLLPGLSLSVGLVNGLAHWCGKDNQDEIKSSSLSIVVLAAAWALLVMLFRSQIAALLGWSSFQVELFALALFGALASTLLEELLVFKGRVWSGALLASGTEIFRTLAMALAAYYQRTLEAVLIVHVSVTIIKSLISIVGAAHLGALSIRLKRESFSSVWRYAFPVSVAGLLGVILNYADRFILASFISAEEFAIYALGCLSIPPLFMLEYSATRVLIPELSSALARSDKEYARLRYRETVSQIALFAIPATFGLALFAPQITELLFTARYLEGSRYLALFSLSYLLLIIPYDAVPRAQGKGSWILRNFAASSALALVLSASLAALFGAMGALLGVITAQTAMRVWGLSYAQRELETPLTKLLPIEDLSKYSISSIFLSLLSLLLKPLFISAISWFLFCASAFALIYLALQFGFSFKTAKSKPTLLFVTQHFEMGGLEKLIASLAKRVKTDGRCNVSIFSYDEDEDAKERGLAYSMRAAGVPVETYKKGRGFSLIALIKLCASILKNRVTVVHSHDLGALMYCALAKIILFGGFRLVHTQHSFVHIDVNKRYRSYERFFTKFVDELSVVHESSKETYVALGLDPDCISVIQNGIDVTEGVYLSRDLKIKLRAEQRERLIADLNWNELPAFLNSNWLISLARYHPVKGQRHILEGWRNLDSELRENSVLLFIGPDVIPGELAVLEELARELPNRERIFFFESTQQPELWLRCADLYLSLSEFEGLPLGPLEAVAHAVPTLLSKIDGHKFLTKESWQVDLSSAPTVAHAIATILGEIHRADEKFYIELLRRAKTVREKFGAEEMFRRYFALYTAQETAPLVITTRLRKAA